MDLDIFKLKLTIDSFVKHAIVRLGGVYHISNSYYEFLVSLNLSFSFPLGISVLHFFDEERSILLSLCYSYNYIL